MLFIRLRVGCFILECYGTTALQTGRDEHYNGPAVCHAPLLSSHILQLKTKPVNKRGTNDQVQDTLGHQHVKYDISQDKHTHFSHIRPIRLSQ